MSWNPDVDPTNRIIAPVGLPLAVISASCVFLVLGLVLTGIRLYIRVIDRVFGLDDWFMAFGCFTYIAAVGVGSAAELLGIGTLDKDLNQWQFEESKKIHTVWLCVYVIPMCLVKASICITLLRIVEARITLRYIVYGLLVIVGLAFVATFVGTLVQCQPLEAEWKPQLVTEGKATCAPIEIFVSLGYIATVAVIIIDATLVAIPALVLWDSLMSTTQKLQIFAMLSVGSAASIITIVRIPFVKRYSNTEDQHYWIAMIVLCSHVETGIGLVAPSLPHLRRLWMIHISGTAQTTPQPPNTDDIVTIGRFPRSKTRKFATDSFKNPTDVGISLTTIQANADGTKTWRSTQGDHHGGGLDDDGELLERREGGGIETVHSYTVEYEHEWDGDSSILESGKSARASSRNV